MSGAFWSRDAYWWSFPAILLADPDRARHVLLASLQHAGADIAHHALYITGTKLYPGFELDQLTAPLIALWRYVDATADHEVLTHPAVLGYLNQLLRELDDWQHPQTGLYGTFLLPTDDPTDHPYTATNNATVCVAFRILAALSTDPAPSSEFAQRADALHDAMQRHLVRSASHAEEEPGELRWAWAVNAAGHPEYREEPPLSLRTLAYWGLTDHDRGALDAYNNTTMWLVSGYEHHYSGAYPGAGAPHFPHPSAFDLANRMLTDNHDLGDPVAQFSTTPMDAGVGCESWHADTGAVATGAAMASVSGFLAWTAWANHIGHRRWSEPLGRNAPADRAGRTDQPE